MRRPHHWCKDTAFDQAVDIFAAAHPNAFVGVGDELGDKVQVTSSLGTFLFENQTAAIPHLLGKWPKPPKLPKSVQALSVSERKLFDHAVCIYRTLPPAPELRNNFHCARAVADKIHAALKACFRSAKRKQS
jgi:hypothetical protein